MILADKLLSIESQITSNLYYSQVTNTTGLDG